MTLSLPGRGGGRGGGRDRTTKYWSDLRDKCQSRNHKYSTLFMVKKSLCAGCCKLVWPSDRLLQGMAAATCPGSQECSYFFVRSLFLFQAFRSRMPSVGPYWFISFDKFPFLPPSRPVGASRSSRPCRAAQRLGDESQATRTKPCGTRRLRDPVRQYLPYKGENFEPVGAQSG